MNCINARGEMVKATPAFRDAYMRRRCIVPADAFFEWRANGKAKQPYAIAFAFPGLWGDWKDPETQDWVCTYAILTTKPNEVVAPDREEAMQRIEKMIASEMASAVSDWRDYRLGQPSTHAGNPEDMPHSGFFSFWPPV